MGKSNYDEGSFAGGTVDWMAHLPPKLSSTPLFMLAIPGSHNSCSYSLTRDSDLSPDEPGFRGIKRLFCCNRVAKSIIRRWAATQNLTCTQQLRAGVRFFDMRVAPHRKKQTFNFVHALIGLEIQDALIEISTFLKTHRKEIVLIHFQHFYEFTSKMHELLINDIIDIFGNQLCPVHYNLDILTLDYLWSKRFQVIIFYKYHKVFDITARMWPDGLISYPWPDKDSASRVIDYLEERYKEGRPSNQFYVVQGILTPSGKTIMLYFCSSLKNKAAGMNSKVSSLILDKDPKKLNIILVDFVNVSFCANVIKLNYNYVYRND